MAQVGSLSVKLGLVTVEWDKATAQAKQQAKDLQKSFDELGGGVKKLNEYWKMMGGAISVGSLGMAGLIQQTISFTDDISDLAKGFDLTISQTLAFRSALMGAGVSADGAAKMMSALFGKIDDAKHGNDKTIAQFEKMGITFAELKTMAPYEAVQRVAAGFSEISDSFERVKQIKDFFGKAGVGLDIEALNEVLKEGSGKFDKYAESVKKVGVINDNIKRSLDNLKIAFADLVAPFARDNIVSIEKFQAILMSIAAVTVVATVSKLAVAFVEVAVAIREAAAAGALFNMTAGGASPIGLAIKAASVVAGFATYQYMTAKGKSAGPESPGVGALIAQHDKAAQEAEKLAEQQAEASSKEASALEARVKLQKQLLVIEVAKINVAGLQIVNGEVSTKLRTNELGLAEKIADIEARRKQELLANKDGTKAMIGQVNALADAEVARARASFRANQQAALFAEKYKREVEQLNAYHIATGMDNEQETPAQMQEAEQGRTKSRVDFQNQTTEANRQLAITADRYRYEQSISLLNEKEREILLDKYDLETRINEYKRQSVAKGESAERIAIGEKDMREAGQKMTNFKRQAVDTQRTFAYGWQQAFNTYYESATNAASIAGQAFQTITGAMEQALDSFVKTGKLNFASLVQSVLQGLIQIQLRASMVSLFKGAQGAIGDAVGNMFGGGGLMSLFQQRATGGSVTANTPYLVGERGPELFVPQGRSGSIVPTNALSAGGGQSVTNNYNIQAIDVKSFEQRLLSSAPTIWAANKYGEKNLAVGFGRA